MYVTRYLIHMHTTSTSPFIHYMLFKYINHRQKHPRLYLPLYWVRNILSVFFTLSGWPKGLLQCWQHCKGRWCNTEAYSTWKPFLTPLMTQERFQSFGNSSPLSHRHSSAVAKWTKSASVYSLCIRINNRCLFVNPSLLPCKIYCEAKLTLLS